jgi:proteic killer suppression protein
MVLLISLESRGNITYGPSHFWARQEYIGGLTLKAGSRAGIQPAHAKKFRLQLSVLDANSRPDEMNFPGWRLHKRSGNFKDHRSVTMSGNWRLTFAFEGEDTGARKPVRCALPNRHPLSNGWPGLCRRHSVAVQEGLLP